MAQWARSSLSSRLSQFLPEESIYPAPLSHPPHLPVVETPTVASRRPWSGARVRAAAGEHGCDQQHPREHRDGQVLGQPLVDDKLRQEREGSHGVAGDATFRGNAEVARAGIWYT